MSRAIPVTGRGGPCGCETSRLPHFLYNRFTDGGDVLSPTRRLRFTLLSRKNPGTRFWQMLSQPQEVLGQGEKLNDLIRNRIRDLPAYSLMPQPTTLTLVPISPCTVSGGGNFTFESISNIKKKLHGLSPRANYTDRATAACRRSDYQLLRIEGDTWSAWRIPTAVLSDF
jgi:hypothetical protein